MFSIGDCVKQVIEYKKKKEYIENLKINPDKLYNRGLKGFFNILSIGLKIVSVGNLTYQAVNKGGEQIGMFFMTLGFLFPSILNRGIGGYRDWGGYSSSLVFNQRNGKSKIKRSK
jgi:hypothetical protein